MPNLPRNKVNKKKMKKKGANPNIQNYVPNKGKIVYGLQQFAKGKIKFFSNYTQEGVDTVHTIKDNPLHNYHYWLIDKRTGKLIDPTPPQMDAIPNKTAIYIPWSEEEQQEQKAFNLQVRLQELSMTGTTLHEWIKGRVEGKVFEKKRCFQNCFSIHNYYKDKYELVCGSMGWIMGENEDGVIGVNMDYGF